MRKASPKVFHLSGRILRSQGEDALPVSAAEALRQAVEGLRPRLVPLVGGDGYRALLSRAVALAKQEHPLLAPLQPNQDEWIARLGECGPAGNAAELEAACCAILASLFSLLTSFLGVELTRQMVSDAWPGLAVQNTDFSTEREV